MLIYTYKLEKYIKNKIFRTILLAPDKYTIKGSFRRKIPYVTDIDVVNEVYPEINRTNIYLHLKKLVENVLSQKDRIILAYAKCGVDERFKLKNGTDEEIYWIKPLLTPEEIDNINTVM